MKFFRFFLLLALAASPPGASAAADKKGKSIPRIPSRAATAPLGRLAAPAGPVSAKPAASAVSPSAAALSADPGEGSPRTRGPQAAQARPSSRPFDDAGYFITELTSLGVPSETVAALRSYLEEPKRHPGDQNKVYHGKRHSTDVPNGMAAVLATLPAEGVDAPTRVALILSAALHDIDPERPPETPARVSATLPYLASDPDSRGLIEKFAQSLGVSAERLRDIISLNIKMTDFSADPAVRAKIGEDFKAMLEKLYPDPSRREEARKHAELLAFVDKAVTYLRADPKEAEIQVQNLAHEFRKGIEAGTLDPKTPIPTVTGTFAFLDNFLVKSPYYAMLPKDLGGRFQSTLAHFKDKQAEPASAGLDPAAPSRAPPAAAAALEKAAQEAKPLLAGETGGSAADEIDRELGRLNAEGFAVLAPGALMDREAQGRILTELALRKATKKDGTTHIWLYFNPHPRLAQRPVMPIGWNTDSLSKLGDRGGIQSFVSRLDELLKTTLPDEGLELFTVELRWTQNSEPTGDDPHVDGGYLTATLALKGSGTVLYHSEGGRVRVQSTPSSSVVLITAEEREQMRGIAGTVHAAPGGKQEERVVLILRYRSGLYPGSLSTDLDPVVRRTVRERQESVRRQLGWRPKQPPPGEAPSAE